MNELSLQEIWQGFGQGGVGGGFTFSWGELLHVDMFAHNKSGITYQDGNRRSKTVVYPINNLVRVTKGNPTSS
jgi:hypothetical protein